MGKWLDEFKKKSPQRIGQQTDKADSLEIKDNCKPIKNIVDTIASLYSKAGEALGEHYLPRCTAWLEENQPEFNNKINEAEDYMWEIGNKVKEGKADIQDFQEALKKYYELMLAGIHLHKQALK